MMFEISLPRRHRIVYVGQSGRGFLKEYIRDDDTVTYVAPGQKLNLWVLLLALLRGWWSRRGYYGAFLRLTRPDFVVTQEDNAMEFYFTKIYLPGARSLCLQNGRRGTFSDNPDRTIWDVLRKEVPASAAPDVVLVHGAPAISYYRAALGKTAKLLPAGNLTNNAFALSEESRRPRLLFVSSFPSIDSLDLLEVETRPMGFIEGSPITMREFYSAEGTVAKLAAQYSETHGLQFAVIGKRPATQTSEYQYFESALRDHQWIYLPSEPNSASYGAVTQNDIVVNVDSTFGYEMMARGVRVAFVTARMPLAGHPEIRDFDFAYPFITAPTGPFWTNKPSRDEVFRVIDAVIARPNSEWCAGAGIDMSEIFYYDKGNTILCKTLDEFGIHNSGPQILG